MSLWIPGVNTTKATNSKKALSKRDAELERESLNQKTTAIQHSEANALKKGIIYLGLVCSVFAVTIYEPWNAAEANTKTMLTQEGINQLSMLQKAALLEKSIIALKDDSVMGQYLIALDNDPTMDVVYQNLKSQLEDDLVFLNVSDANQKKLILAIASYVSASQAAGRSIKEMEHEFNRDFFNDLSPTSMPSANNLLWTSAIKIFDTLKDKNIAQELGQRALSVANQNEEFSMS